MCYLLLLQRLVEHASAEAIGSCSGRGHPGGEGARAKPIGPTTTSPARLVDQAEPQPEHGPGPEPEPEPEPEQGYIPPGVQGTEFIEGYADVLKLKVAPNS